MKRLIAFIFAVTLVMNGSAPFAAAEDAAPLQDAADTSKYGADAAAKDATAKAKGNAKLEEARKHRQELRENKRKEKRENRAVRKKARKDSRAARKPTPKEAKAARKAARTEAKQARKKGVEAKKAGDEQLEETEDY